MTGEEMERAIEFLIEHHARTSTELQSLKEAQERTTVNLQSLTESVSRLENQAEIDRQEMRDAIDKLILSNEITRDLANQVARLAVATSQRVTEVEQRVT